MVKEAEKTLGKPLCVAGFRIFQAALERGVRSKVLADVLQIIELAPLFSPMTPYGRKMSVQMTSAGRLGWYSDRSGYRYAERHPSGTTWPQIPASVLEIWQAFLPDAPPPDSCLVNYYGEGARMGLHQDRDEGDFSFPVLSVSLGDDALFRMGGTVRRGKTSSVWLKSGDVVVIGGAARLAYHGIDRIRFGSSSLVPGGGRINLTLRVVR
ncbi:MAG: alpha-ketoglutarate-dependent dioxygenase AlkB [Paracoccaceae bacterium]|nr:alpha-ketoglutarate-dependent dioxygenase AlkB [Paracoccaceae bacterium]